MIFPPSPDLIDNLKVRLESVEVRNGRLPLTINDGGKTCYICCPSEAYLAYGREELRHFDGHPLLKGVLAGLIEGVRPLIALSEIDRQVQPNNALLSTNILPDLTRGEIAEVTHRLAAAHPDHVIVWRSVNDHDPSLKSAFITAGYKALPARRVYLFDARSSGVNHRGITHQTYPRDLRRDFALLAQADYTRIGPQDLVRKDFERIVELYAKLYLDKYTQLNPRYSAAFFYEAHQSGFLQFHALRSDSGQIDGVIGFFRGQDTLTAPVVGYDTHLPQSLGLYRRLMAIGFETAIREGLLYNMSAGAGAFKRNRGAIGVFEYMMVYDRHVSGVRRWAISAVASLLERAGKPMLIRYEL